MNFRTFFGGIAIAVAMSVSVTYAVTRTADKSTCAASIAQAVATRDAQAAATREAQQAAEAAQALLTITGNK